MAARDFVSNYCREHGDEEKRFYSCGGDGTLNEVANGAVGFSKTEITCFPVGSGNDFVRTSENPGFSESAGFD